MKKAILALCGGIFLLVGCTEQGPPINLVDTVNADTTYTVSPAPAAEPHNVLAEEFTGQSCPNCPAAHDLLNGLAAAGRLNVIGLYINGLTQTVPPSGAAYDFRTVPATDISANIYLGGPGAGIPCGGIDRIPVSGNLSLYSSQWTDAYNQRLTVTDSVNLSVSSTYSASDSMATITATVIYTQDVSTSQNISIVIVEDTIVDKQEIPTGVDDNYAFTNVFRDMVTSEPYGDPVASKLTLKPAGTANQKTYKYKLNAAWRPDHCRVIAFVHYSNKETTKDVFQSVQCKLAP